MKDSKKHYIFVLAALVSFVVAGCSSVKSSKEPIVRDAVADVIAAPDMLADDIATGPSLALVGRSNSHLSARSNSVWISQMIVTEPIPQGTQRPVSQPRERITMESPRQSQPSQPVRTISEEPKVVSPSRRTASVDDRLKKVLSGRNTTSGSTVRDALSGVIVIPETADDEEN